MLTGFAKGLDYRPGDKFKGTEFNHSWNAVYIDDNWYLVDSHWATRYLVSDKNVPENLVRRTSVKYSEGNSGRRNFTAKFVG